MKYKKLIKQMTLEEKASLASGENFWNTKSIERLGIPSMMLTDGPHGLRKQGGRADHLGLHASMPATCYPTAAGLANTWDEALLEEMGEYLGLEAAAEEVSVILGPGCNIKRNPLCGRNFEYFSEDPYLSGKMAAALSRGIQKNGISACVKHFAANSQEHRRMTNDSVMDERTLREIYLPAFEMAVKEGDVGTVMTSYNLLNGTYANENQHLLQEILVKEWGFDGVVVTDWGGNNDRVKGLIAGSHLEMPSTKGETDRQIAEAVKAGELDEHLLDERVDALLRLVFTTKKKMNKRSFDKKKHHRKAMEIAVETAVLLKNEERLLPLQPGQQVAVIGDFAENPRYQGSGSSKINPTRLDNALEALKREGASIIDYAPGYKRRGGKDDKLLREACSLAGRADVVLLFLGLDEGGEAEGADRTAMSLPDNQLRLLRAIKKVNPKIGVVLSCGCAVEMDWDIHAKAVLHGYLGGQAGASAAAKLLIGKQNPSGKLAETVPKKYQDIPSAAYYPGMERTAEYREGIYVGYRYFDTAKVPVKYPFGYGLSYTSYEYSKIKTKGDQVTFYIKNTGRMRGRETAQLYIAAHTNGMFRPSRELKGFVSVVLEPGEKKQVSIPLNDRSYSVWSIQENDWVIEPGEYELQIGASSADIRLKEAVKKEGPKVKNPYGSEVFASYYSGQVKKVSDESFKALLGRDIPPSKWNPDEPLTFNDTISQGRYLEKGLGRTLYRMVNLTRRTFLLLGKKEYANNSMFVMNLPYRGIARMSGVLNDKQVHALLKVINREKGGWKAFGKACIKRK